MHSCIRPPRLRAIIARSLYSPCAVQRNVPPRLTASTSQLPSRTRAFSSTPRPHEDVTSEDEVNEAAPLTPRQDGEVFGGDTYDEWILTVGPKWKDPDPLGPKWLGGSVPFPLNPTFKPPTPISDTLRTAIYTSHLMNPQENDLHTLSTRYGIAVKRIEAIIRLKDLEEQWKKSKPLQTGFLNGMERLLGLKAGGRATAVADEIQSHDRLQVNAADEVSRQATDEGRDKKRGISRTFFEPVDEGQQPLVPGLLDEQQDKTRTVQTQKSVYPVKVVQPDPLRPAFKFVDVGLRWVDHRDMSRRERESRRRKAVKEGKKMIKQTVEAG